MSLQKILNDIDKVGDGYDKYNQMCDELIVGGGVNSEYIYFNKYNNTNFINQILINNTITGLTYDEITTLKISNELIIGKYYLLDYQTIHTIPNTTDNYTGSTEQLLLFATQVNMFDPLVKSINYPEDIIYYDFNDTTTESGSIPRPGRIIYRKDTINNIEMYYDWREVRFRRWEISYIQNGIEWQTGTTYTANTLIQNGEGNYFITMCTTLSANTFSDISDSFININQYLGKYLGTSSNGMRLNDITLSATTNYIDYKTLNHTSNSNILIRKYTYQNYNNIVINPLSLYLNHAYNIQCLKDCNDINIFGSQIDFLKMTTSNEIHLIHNLNNLEINQSRYIYSKNLINNSVIFNSYNLIINNYNNIINSNDIKSSSYDVIINSSNINISEGVGNNKITNSSYVYLYGSSGDNIIESSDFIYLSYNSTKNLIYQGCNNIKLGFDNKNITNETILTTNNIIYQGCSNLDLNGVTDNIIEQNCRFISNIDVLNPTFTFNVISSNTMNKTFTGTTINNVKFLLTDNTSEILGDNSFKSFDFRDSGSTDSYSLTINTSGILTPPYLKLI